MAVITLGASPLVTALEAHAAAPSSAARLAYLEALGPSVVYLFAPQTRAVERTRREPALQVGVAATRRAMLFEAPGDRCLLAFSRRSMLGEWSASNPGFAPEPIDGAGLTELAARLGASIVLDPALPTHATVTPEEIAWSRCARRALAREPFGEALLRWRGAPNDPARRACIESFRDALCFVTVLDRASAPEGALLPGETLCAMGALQIVVSVDEAGPLLNVNTDGDRVAAWAAAEPYLRFVALDGPGAAWLACALGAELGVMVGSTKTVALSPAELASEWPTRALTTADL